MKFEDFRQVISNISNVPLEKINKDSSFRDDLDIDSLQMVNLIVELTARFGLEGFRIQSDKDLSTVWGMYQMMAREDVTQ